MKETLLEKMGWGGWTDQEISYWRDETRLKLLQTLKASCSCVLIRFWIQLLLLLKPRKLLHPLHECELTAGLETHFWFKSEAPWRICYRISVFVKHPGRGGNRASVSFGVSVCSPQQQLQSSIGRNWFSGLWRNVVPSLRDLRLWPKPSKMDLLLVWIGILL